MAALRVEQILRTEKIIAWLRLAVVALTGAEVVRAALTAGGRETTAAAWAAGLVYAVGVLWGEPYRRVPVHAWDVASGLVDWGLISLGIVVTGGVHSDLYLVYFLAVLSRAMRLGFGAVAVTGAGTVLGYLALMFVTTSDWPQAMTTAGLRMGFLFLFSVGSGVLAREANRQFEGRVKEEARRFAMQEVTATVSHDLKNPLTAITGMVDMLLDSAPDTLSLNQRAILHRINANAQQMRDLVTNLLDAELIERGQQPFRPVVADVNVLVRRVIEAQAHQAEEKQIGLVLDLGRGLPHAAVDCRMVERLVANLLSNAVKFTPEGGAIRVSTRQRGARLCIEVWDSGPGVPAPLQATMFEKFVRQEDSPGIGLGLYICKSIIDRHGGTISARRPDEGGVAFVAEVPLVRAGAAAQREMPDARPAARSPSQLRRRLGAAIRS